MSTVALRLVEAGVRCGPPDEQQGWLEWLGVHVDPAWRPGEWDHGLWLFTGDLDSDRTVAWRCRTPSCRGITRRHDARCDTCRHAQAEAGVVDEAFDQEPRKRRFSPLVPGTCSVPGCQRDLNCYGLCRAHTRMWETRRAAGETYEEFLAQAKPLGRVEPCEVPGCGRERISGPGLCSFHADRLRRERGGVAIRGQELTAWVAAQSPRLGAHQFSLAALGSMVRLELLYVLQRRDENPPPIDPMQVRVVVARLGGATSVRRLDLGALAASGGQQYNATVKGLVDDLGRHLGRAWTSASGADPCAGDVWELALLDIQANGSRRYPVREGVVDFGPIGHGWLREVAKQWARDTHPYLQNLRQAVWTALG